MSQNWFKWLAFSNALSLAALWFLLFPSFYCKFQRTQSSDLTISTGVFIQEKIITQIKCMKELSWSLFSSIISSNKGLLPVLGYRLAWLSQADPGTCQCSRCSRGQQAHWSRSVCSTIYKDIFRIFVTYCRTYNLLPDRHTLCLYNFPKTGSIFCSCCLSTPSRLYTKKLWHDMYGPNNIWPCHISNKIGLQTTFVFKHVLYLLKIWLSRTSKQGVM